MLLAICVAALFKVDLMICGIQSRTNLWGLCCFVGQLSPMAGIVVCPAIQSPGYRVMSFAPAMIVSVAPSDALAGLYASHVRGSPLLWSQSYNETCEI